MTNQMQRVRAALAWRAPAASLALNEHDAPGFASLPHAVAFQIFALLPADARARAAVVCRAWRAAVAQPSLWTRLDLSPSSGVKRPVSNAALRGAAARARGTLKVLVLDECYTAHAAQLEVIAANAGAMRKLSCYFDDAVLRAGSVEALTLAAPRLQLFQADTVASVDDAVRMLRNQAPFGALRVRNLQVEHDTADEADIHELAAAMQGHASLRKLVLVGFRFNVPAELDAVAAAAVACRLQRMGLMQCRLSPASVPALARVIRGGVLTSVFIDNDHHQLLDEPAAAQLADAITASRTLAQLNMQRIDFWRAGPAAAAVLHALTGHPSVCELNLGVNIPHGRAAAGAALGALVAANAPALRKLDLHSCNLGDAGWAPLLDALPRNTHLHRFDCCNTGMTAELARDRFLPSVRANASLRELSASPWWGNQERGVAPPEVLEAEALVAARSARIADE